MKRLVLLILFVAVATCTFAQKNKKKNDVDPRVLEMIESRRYKIDASTAFPSMWRSVSLDSRYGLEVRGDSLFSYLPYYGRAYRLPYGGGEGLIFDSLIKDYTIKPGKKGSTQIRFKSSTKEDVYSFMMVIFPNGNTSISVSSNNKQSIDFSGKMAMEPKTK